VILTVVKRGYRLAYDRRYQRRHRDWHY